MSYTDYLQRRELDDHLAFQITEPIKELITSNSEALNAQINALERVEAAQAQAAYEVVCAIQDLQEATESGFRHIGSILEWGFSEVIVQISRTNDLLTDIRNLAENRSLTWAYEQFNRARDRYRRGHFLEALESVDKAINGHGTELGDSTEHRFHYLRGIIRLGSLKNHSSDVVDLAEAEQAFLTSAKYAVHDFPAEAADSLMCAAHAANLLGHYADAAEYAERGLRLRDTAGLRYENARALLQLKKVLEAEEHLQWAIRLDKNLLIKAVGDPAFYAEQKFLEGVMRGLQVELRAMATESEKRVTAELSALNGVNYRSPAVGYVYSMVQMSPLTLSMATIALDRVKQAQSTGGVLDLRNAIEGVFVASSALESGDSDFKYNVTSALSEASRTIQSEAQEKVNQRHTRRAETAELRERMPWIIGIAICLIWGAAGGFGSYLVGAFLGGLAGWAVSAAQEVAARVWADENSSILAKAKKVKTEIDADIQSLENRTAFAVSSRAEEYLPSWASPPMQETS